MKRAPNPRRAELRDLSLELRPLVKAGVYAKLNDAIVAHYRTETGAQEWHNFADWRKAGRPVRKGERGFPIWGTPRHLQPAEGATMAGDLGMLAALNGVEPEGPQWFPVAYIFHAGQVQGVPDLAQPELFGELAA